MARNPQLEKVQQAFEDRPAAEKIILAVVLAGLVFWLYLILVSDPLKAEINSLQQQIRNNENRLVTMQSRAQQAETSSTEDPNRAARQQLERLIAQETRASEQLAALTGSVVAPLQMNRLLTGVLNLHPDLRLLKVENQVPQQITGTRSGAVNAQAANLQRVFRHGLQLEFEGDYLSTLRYIVYLESLSENFYWDAIRIQTEEWPRARINLEIHTLSQEENFVGI
ncbi:MAG: type II secretion system protein GspM [Pseudomonadales bacterium]|nr:type II secretion system protein GspM [Pseudomonadales bacterium]